MHRRIMAKVDSLESSMIKTESTTELKMEDPDEKINSSASSIWKIFQLCVSLLLGFLFGFALEKTRVFEPSSIRQQMVFRKWIMMKMFLSAVASGQLVLSLLSLLPITKNKFQRASDEYIACFTKKGILTSCLGPFILGAGMTVSGACPGMVLAQIGAWVPNSIFTLLGCLLGALVYGLIAPSIERITTPKETFPYQQVHTQFQKPFAAFALPMGILLSVVVFLLEYFLDYRDDLEHPEDLSFHIFKTVAWPPFVGGIIVGCLQFPMVLVIEDTIGGSSSYVTIVSQWVVTKKLQERFPYLSAKRTGVSNWWQVLYVGGAILGALSSAAASTTLANSDYVQGVGIFEAVFGGILMLLGARLAAGCTSGHGISGLGMLAWLSFIAVPFMFGGAISVAYIMDATDHLDKLVNSTLDW